MRFMTHYRYMDENINGKLSTQYGTDNIEPSLTQQSDAEDADINVILERFKVTGQLPQIQMQPLYADFTNVGSYRDAVEAVREANEAFGQVPAKVRAEFDNDPQKFMDFAMDPNNHDKMVEWGLAEPKKNGTMTEPTPTPAPAPPPAPNKEEPTK